MESAVVLSSGNINHNYIETLNSIKKSGFKNVFIKWYDRDYTLQNKELEYARQLGLNIIFAHLGYDYINDLWNDCGDYLVSRYKSDIKTCFDNGINLVVMHLCAGFDAPMYNEIGIRRLKEIASYAEELGVRIAFENTKVQGYQEYVLSNIHNKNVGICFDIGHAHAHFKDKFNFELFKDKIFAVHIHDNNGELDEHLIPFDGNIDYKYYLKKLKECNYNGPMTLELYYTKYYLNTNLDSYYKKGYEVSNTLINMYNNI